MQTAQTEFQYIPLLCQNQQKNTHPAAAPHPNRYLSQCAGFVATTHLSMLGAGCSELGGHQIIRLIRYIYAM